MEHQIISENEFVYHIKSTKVSTMVNKKSITFFDGIFVKDGDNYNIKLDSKLSLDRIFPDDLLEKYFVETVDINKLSYIIMNNDKLFNEVCSTRDNVSKGCILLNYISKLKKDNKIDVNYIQNEKLQGRYQSEHSLSLQNMVREFRHIVSREYYYDIDIVNCHASILVWLCRNLNIDSTVVSDYVNNRQQHFDDLYKLNPEATKDDLKTLFIRTQYNCGQEMFDYFDFKASKPVKKINHTEFVKKYRAFFKLTAKLILDRFPGFVNLCKEHLANQNELNKTDVQYHHGKGLAHLCLYVENKCLMMMLKKREGCGVSYINDFPLVLCFDGFMIAKHRREKWAHKDICLSSKTINEYIGSINNVFKSFDFSEIQIMVKDMPDHPELMNEYDSKYDYYADVKQLIKNKDKLNESDIDNTFSSPNNKALLSNMLTNMGSSMDKFTTSMLDCDYENDEIWTWFDKHIIIKNNLYGISDIRFNDFERLIKCLKFESLDLAIKFVFYFLNEIFIFLRNDTKNVYYKTTPTSENPENLMKLSIDTITSLNIAYKIYNEKEDKVYYKYYGLKRMLSLYPYHIFERTAYIWNQKKEDINVMSMSQPFNIIVNDSNMVDVSQEDLPEILFDYFINILCNGDLEHWNHLRAYLANIILKPDEKTGIMLVLYSQEKRLGKSTLYDLLSIIMNKANIGKIDNIKDAVGERGAYAFIDKKILWFEETKGADNSASYVNCMDRLKTLITDPTHSYRSMFEGAKTTRNHFELIACTNNLIGVAEDRMTILHVSDIHKDDKVYYNEFRETCLKPEVLSKFIMYLSKFTTRNPMTPIKTNLYLTMTENNAEPIEQFINEIPNITILSESSIMKYKGLTRQHVEFEYVLIKDIYLAYKIWYAENGFNKNKQLNQIKFGSRIEHYNRNLKVRKIVHDNKKDVRVLTAPLNYFLDGEDGDE